MQDSSQQGKGISKVGDHHDFKYVWSGFFINGLRLQLKKNESNKIIEARSGPDGYIFIKAEIPRENFLFQGLRTKVLGIF